MLNFTMYEIGGINYFYVSPANYNRLIMELTYKASTVFSYQNERYQCMKSRYCHYNNITINNKNISYILLPINIDLPLPTLSNISPIPIYGTNLKILKIPASVGINVNLLSKCYNFLIENYNIKG